MAVLPTLRAYTTTCTFGTTSANLSTFQVSYTLSFNSSTRVLTMNISSYTWVSGTTFSGFQVGSAAIVSPASHQSVNLSPAQGGTTGPTSISFTIPAGHDSDYLVAYDLSQTPNFSATQIFGTLNAGAPPGTASNPVSWTLTNNLGSTQSIQALVGGSVVQTFSLPSTSTQTFTFTASGTAGTAITISPIPTWVGASDPMIITSAGDTITRTGAYGLPPTTKHVRLVFYSYSTLSQTVTIKLDGATLGTVALNPSVSGKAAMLTQYDYDLNLSPSSVVSLVAPSGHTLTQPYADTISGSALTMVRLLDDGAGAHDYFTVTTPAPDGTITSTSTDTSTGTTSVTHSTPQSGTNTTSTAPSGGPTMVGGAVNFGNTSTNAGSAANQDASNSLASIANSTSKTAANTAGLADITSRQKSDLPSVDSTLASLSTEANASNLLTQAQSRATSMQAAAQNAISQLGTVPGTPTDGADPGDPTVLVKVTPTQTITWHLNPFSSSGPFGGVVGTVGGFIKRLIAWGIVATFLIQVAKELRCVLGTIFLTSPNHSQILDALNSVRVLGNSVGVPVAVTLRVALIAGLVTLLLTIPLAIAAAVEAGLPWSSLVNTFNAGPVAAGGTPTMLSTAIGYASQVIPWATLTATPVYYFVLHTALFPVQAFWQMVIKVLP